MRDKAIQRSDKSALFSRPCTSRISAILHICSDIASSKSVFLPRLTVCLRRSPLQPTFAVVKASNYPSLANMPHGVVGRVRRGEPSPESATIRIIERGKKPLDRSLDVDDRGKIHRAANNDPPRAPPRSPSCPTAPSLGASRLTRFSASGGHYVWTTAARFVPCMGPQRQIEQRIHCFILSR